MQYRSLGRSGITVSAVCLGTMTFGEQTREHGLVPGGMALAYTMSRPFIASTIVGARTSDQLRENLALAEHTKLNPEVIAAIEAIHAENPNPLLK